MILRRVISWFIEYSPLTFVSILQYFNSHGYTLDTQDLFTLYSLDTQDLFTLYTLDTQDLFTLFTLETQGLLTLYTQHTQDLLSCMPWTPRTWQPCKPRIPRTCLLTYVPTTQYLLDRQDCKENRTRIDVSIQEAELKPLMCVVNWERGGILLWLIIKTVSNYIHKKIF